MSLARFSIKTNLLTHNSRIKRPGINLKESVYIGIMEGWGGGGGGVINRKYIMTPGINFFIPLEVDQIHCLLEGCPRT